MLFELSRNANDVNAERGLEISKAKKLGSSIRVSTGFGFLFGLKYILFKSLLFVVGKKK